MSFNRPYAESEPPSEGHTSHDLAFIALGILGILHFNWDSGNHRKNENKHGVSSEEIETAIKDKHAFVALIPQQKTTYRWDEEGFEVVTEKRYLLFSKRGENKYLKVVFTLRIINNLILIRPISAHHVKEKDVHRKLHQSRYNDGT